ncbi:hypothetical protein KCU89_g68, partial [Aureobasidium melanogenum]
LSEAVFAVGKTLLFVRGSEYSRNDFPTCLGKPRSSEYYSLRESGRPFTERDMRSMNIGVPGWATAQLHKEGLSRPHLRGNVSI